MNRLVQCAAVAVFIAAGFSSTRYALSTVPAGAPDEIVAPDEPRQVDLVDADPIDIAGGRLIPVAQFDAEVRVLLKTRYDHDRFAKVAPYDLGVSWGEMSHNANVDRYEFHHRSRFLVWYPDSSLSMEERTSFQNMTANFHIIPANEEVEKQIARARPDQLIELKGYLVNVQMDNGLRASTSLTRDDTGGGACEVIYVESAYAMSIR